jgi:hypothetical protein
MVHVRLEEGESGSSMRCELPYFFLKQYTISVREIVRLLLLWPCVIGGLVSSFQIANGLAFDPVAVVA